MWDTLEVALPSGLVTFVLTDIEGSTRLFRQIGDRYPPLLDLHREILRSVWVEFGGVEFKTEGDACLVAFEDSAAAVEACVHAQRRLSAQPWPSDSAIRVRIGAHTGLAYPRGDDYVAIAVHQAARVVNVAHGGQIVVSADTAHRAVNGGSFFLTSLGHYRVRDFDDPVELFQAGGVGVVDVFPPLRTLPADQHNLAAPITSLVGRGSDLLELAELVRANRLVTVVGPGGLGKTRLAVEYGLAHARDWQDGLWFVDLAKVSEPIGVGQAVAESVGAPFAGEDLWEAVAEYLRDRQTVVLLDNCEHLVADIAVRVDRLLRSCRQVRVLATSRQPIGLRVERIWRPDHLPADTSAADLFNDRAGITVSDRGAKAAVVELCRRLDGLPLAIELAAAHADVMGPSEILARLDRAAGALRSRDPTLDPRQRSLDDVIGWSHQLLTPAEQIAFRRLGLFAAGFDLASGSAAVAGPSVPVDEEPDLVWSLVAKSLLASEPTAGSTRYRMLETVRAYARRELDRFHETEDVALRLGRFYVHRYGPHIDSVDPGFASDRAVNLENFRGLIPTVANCNIETAQTLASIVLNTLRITSNRVCLAEGIDLLRHLTAVTPARAGILAQVAMAAIDAGQFETAETLLDEAEAVQQSIGIPDWLDSRIEQERGLVALNQGDPERARSIALDALKHAATENGERYLVDMLGLVAAELGNYDEATGFIQRSLRISTERGDLVSAAIDLCTLAEIAMRAEDPETAALRQLEGLTIAEQTGAERELMSSVIMAAKFAARSGDWATAARLQSAADRAMSEMGWTLYTSDRELRDNLLATAKAVLGDEQFARVRQVGVNLDRADTITEAHLILASIAEPL